MVRYPTMTSELPWVRAGSLVDFLDYLRTQGFRITVNEYAATHELIVALIDRGIDVRDENVLKSYLGPVLCVSPRDQAAFPSHFDRWVTRRVPEQVVRRPVESELEHEGRKWRSWQWILALISVALAVALVAWWRTSHPTPVVRPAGEVNVILAPVPAQATFHASLNIMLVAVASVLLTGVLWGAWWFYRGRMFLRRQPTVDEPDLLSIRLGSRLPETVEVTLRRSAFQMRRRRAVPSSQLDIGRTTEETVRSNGTFTPVFGSQYVQPEYVFLIDRRSFNDQSARYLDELTDKLVREQVWVTRYYFDEDPRIVTPEDSGHAITLYDFCATNQDRRILFFAEAVALLDPVWGNLAAWAQPIRSLREAALFTPKARDTWSSAEQLARQVLAVFPATLESIEDFVLAASGEPARTREDSSTEGPFPWELSSRPERWLDRDAPDLALVDDALASVRRWLGADGYFWLAACAVYPEGHFNLTEFLGVTLKGANGSPLFTAQRFASLSRLPWMRSAYMPDWLRLRLVSTIDPEQNQQIREALNALWLSVATGGDRPIELEIAQRNPLAASSIAKAIFRKLRRKSSEQSVLRDRVFASVMLGRSLEPLAVRIPRMWRELMRPEKAPGKPESRRQLWIWRCFATVLWVTGAAGVVLTLGTFLNVNLNAEWGDLAGGGLIIGGVIGLLAGVVTLDGRMLWAGWFLVVALVPTSGIGRAIRSSLTPPPYSSFEFRRYNQLHQNLTEEQRSLLIEREREEYRRYQSLPTAGYCLISLVLLPVVHLLGRRAKVPSVGVPWQRRYVKGVVYLAMLSEALATPIIYLSLKNSDWIERLAVPFLVGVLFFGVLELFPGILLRSRLLLIHALIVTVSPILAPIGDTFIPNNYKLVCAILWSTIFMAFSLWVIHRLGGQLAIVRFAIKQSARLFRAMRTTAPESRPA